MTFPMAFPENSHTPMWRLVVERRQRLGRLTSYRAVAADTEDNPRRLPPLSYGSLARVANGKTGHDPRTLQLLAHAASGTAEDGTVVETTFDELDALDREWREMPAAKLNRPFYVPPSWVDMPMEDREVVQRVGNQLMRARGLG